MEYLSLGMLIVTSALTFRQINRIAKAAEKQDLSALWINALKMGQFCSITSILISAFMIFLIYEDLYNSAYYLFFMTTGLLLALLISISLLIWRVSARKLAK